MERQALPQQLDGGLQPGVGGIGAIGHAHRSAHDGEHLVAWMVLRQGIAGPGPADLDAESLCPSQLSQQSRSLPGDGLHHKQRRHGSLRVAL